MKKLMAVFCLTIAMYATVEAQNSFAYQAVIRTANGELVSNKEVAMQFSLIYNGKVVYCETHKTTTSQYGNVQVKVGEGTVVSGKFAEVPWSTMKVMMKIEADPDGGTNYIDLGTIQLQPAPYAMYAPAAGVVGTVQAGEPKSADGALFEVKDKDGNVVFAVYPDGVRVFVDDSVGKAKSTGFAVQGRRSAKEGGEADIFSVTAAGTQVFVNDDDTAGGKAATTGFAVQGRRAAKDGGSDLFTVGSTGTQIYIDNIPNSGKPAGTGFAVQGRRTAAKDSTDGRFFEISTDGTRVYIDDVEGKPMTTGFSVRGRRTADKDDSDNSRNNKYMEIDANGTKIYVDDPDSYRDGKPMTTGFSVRGRRTAVKGNGAKLFEVNSFGTQIFISDQGGKPKGTGFSVRGRRTAVKDGETDKYMVIDANGTHIYVDYDEAKTMQTGFAVSGRRAAKDGTPNTILNVNAEEGTHVYIEDIDGKPASTGFAVSGRRAAKDGEPDRFKITTDRTLLSITNFAVQDKQTDKDIMSMDSSSTKIFTSDFQLTNHNDSALLTTGNGAGVEVNTDLVVAGDVAQRVEVDEIEDVLPIQWFVQKIDTVKIADTIPVLNSSNGYALLKIYGTGLFAENQNVDAEGNNVILFSAAGNPTKFQQEAVAAVIMNKAATPDARLIIWPLKAVANDFKINFGLMAAGDTAKRYVNVVAYINTPAPVECIVNVKSAVDSLGTVSVRGSKVYGEKVSVVPQPIEGYHFTQWSDGRRANPRTVLIMHDTVLASANFEINTYDLTTTAKNGTIKIEGEKNANGNYNHGTNITLTAIPDEHYHFMGWTDNVATAERQFTIVSDTAFEATFAIDSFNIIVTSENGTVTGAGRYPYGAEIELVATAADTYHFVNWSDGNTDNPRMLTVTNDSTFTAKFDKDRYALTYIVDGKIDGDIEMVAVNATLTLRDSLSRTGYTFSGWSYNGSPVKPEKMPEGNLTVTGSFTINKYKVTFDTDGGSEIAAIEQDFNTAFEMPKEKPVKTGYTFNGWSDTLTAIPAKNTTITAKWAINQYTITFADSKGRVFGTVKDDYNKTLTAPTKADSAGHTFIGWQNLPATIPAKDSTVVGEWTINQHKVTFAAATDGTGTVTATANGKAIESGYKVDYGTEVTLTAEPTRGYFFIRWSDGVTATTRTITKDTTVNAIFKNEFVAGNLKYTLTSASTVSVGKIDNDNKPTDELNIPTMSSDGEDTFSVTAVGKNAFDGCKELTKVTFESPCNITSFGNYSFYGCEELETINIPDGLTSIGNYAFANCYKLASMNFPNSLTSIGEGTFHSCFALKNVSIPGSVTDLSQALFYNSGLTEVTISEGVENIGVWAFYGTQLTSVTIPETVKSIGAEAFSNSKLTKVTIPSSVTSISDAPFSRCKNLTEITVDAGNQNYIAEDNILYSKDKSLLIQYPAGKTEELFVVPDMVTTIGGEAFGGNTNLKHVALPDGVTTIEYRAFYSMGGSSLETITLPSSCTDLNNTAFYYCSNLTIYCQAAEAPANTDGANTVLTNCKAIKIQSTDETKGAASIATAGGYGADGTTWFAAGTEITLVATSIADGYEFAKWTVGGAAVTSPYTVSTDATITATWKKKSYAVTVTSNDTNWGNVIVEGTKDDDGNYVHGTKVTIKAEPSNHYYFVQWSDGDENSTHSEITVTEEINDLKATFAPDDYSVRFDVNITENTAHVDGGMTMQWFTYGKSQPLPRNNWTATGYAFAGWATEAAGAKVYDDEQTITVDGHTKLYAVWFNAQLASSATTFYKGSTLSVDAAFKTNNGSAFTPDSKQLSWQLALLTVGGDTLTKADTAKLTVPAIATLTEGQYILHAVLKYKGTKIAESDFVVTAIQDMVAVKGATVSGPVGTGDAASKVFIDGRTVAIRDLVVSDHEVTQAEYQAVMGTNPSHFTSNPYDGEVQNNRPVEMVNWYDALVYCNTLSIKEGLTPCYSINGSTNPADWGDVPTSNNDATWDGATCNFDANGYRLPTEAEWEYVARGGNGGIPEIQTIYSGSDNIDDVAWYGISESHAVKKKNPNTLGIYDMTGNIWEWCWDKTNKLNGADDNVTPIVSSTLFDGVGEGDKRVGRGGCWSFAADLCGVAYRRCNSPVWKYNDVGFRVVRTANAEPATSYIFVGENDDDNNTGLTFNSPLKTIEAAAAKMNDADANYTICVNGTLTGAQTFSEEFNGKAKSITLCGLNTTDKLDGQSQGTVLTINTTVPVTIKNLTITGGNVAGNGGGIFIASGATLTLADGALVAGNTAEGDDNYTGNGGGVYNAGTLFMYGSAVIGSNTASAVASDEEYSNYARRGGGLYNTTGASAYLGYRSAAETAVLTGGIYYNYTYSDGAGVYNKGTLKMNSGNIVFNASYGFGAGVTTQDNTSLFTLSGGTISNNECVAFIDWETQHGGGVRVGSSTFIMTGGEISNNTSDAAGGVSIVGGTFKMTGGVVKENSARKDIISHGINFESSNFKIGGSAVINNSVRLSNNKTNGLKITICEPFTDNAKIDTLAPDNYENNLTILALDEDVQTSIADVVGKFRLAQNSSKTWYINNEGKLFDGFVSVPGTYFDGAETVATSVVFTAGSEFPIQNMLVCDHEVTQREWETVMGISQAEMDEMDKNVDEADNGVHGIGDNNPAYRVTWYAAIAYCNKRSVDEGLTPVYTVPGIDNWRDLTYTQIPRGTNADTWNAVTCNFDANGYRLPTEAEWEYLARGGNLSNNEQTSYSGSDEIGDVAWYKGNSGDDGGDTNGKTHEVKTKAPNNLVLYDMSGNVWEWCWDSDLQSSTHERHTRGGSWDCWGDQNSDRKWCNVNTRATDEPYELKHDLGLRVVRTVVSNETCTVTYDLQDGSELETQSVRKGRFIKKYVPTRMGYTFKGWYTDAACTEPYNFKAPVTTNVTLYAKWEQWMIPDGESGHYYVDLGTGALWATTNVGAYNPWDYGDYFAWGETEPYYSSQGDPITWKDGKSNGYDWASYKYCNGGSTNNLTKYNNQTSFGTVDNKTILEPDDDAATAYWGTGWAMPRDEDMQNLLDGCYWVWTNDYKNDDTNISGYIVYKAKADDDKGQKVVPGQTPLASYSLADAHIFLPAAGYYASATLRDASVYCDYWTASLGTSAPVNAQSMNAAYSQAPELSINDARPAGAPIRPCYTYAQVNGKIYLDKESTYDAITFAENKCDMVLTNRVTATELGKEGNANTIINAIKNTSASNVSLVVPEGANIVLEDDDCSEMFSGCTKLVSADLRGFNTDKVTDMSGMFEQCEKLTTLDLSNFNTSKVVDMSGMFFECKELTKLDLSNFNTSIVTDMSEMFNGCLALTTIYAAPDANWFKQSGLTSTNMFKDCSALVGGNGSTISSNNNTDDASAARIDEGAGGNSGYFTSNAISYTASSPTEFTSALNEIANSTNRYINYIITISGKLTGAQTMNSNLNGKAKSITLSGNDNTTDILSVSSTNTGSVLTVKTTVPITISNLKIQGGNATFGGGIYCASGSKVTLGNGAIVGEIGSSSAATESAYSNRADKGGGIYVDGGTLTLESGSVVGHNYASDKNAGGVYVKGNGRLYISEGAKIEYNGSGYYSGGVYIDGCAIAEMTGGEISHNDTKAFGGGVCIAGKFTMSGGTISNNRMTVFEAGWGHAGGGVMIEDGGTFNMHGTASIINNYTDGSQGGAVKISGGGTFNMTGGLISGNTSNPDNCDTYGKDSGNGIRVESSNFYIGDSAYIASNNVVQLIGKKVNIISPLTNEIAATILPSNYTAGAKVLAVATSSQAQLKQECGKFAVVSDANGSTLTSWSINSEGKLQPGQSHAFVDLGLSKLWATTNVGATNPQEYGDYIAWGETKPYYSSPDDDPSAWNKPDGYAWASYTKLSDGAAAPTFSKYNSTDGKTTLESADDVATVNWGVGCSMPTQNDYQELCSNCYWVWTDNYNSTGVAGCIVYKAQSNSDKGVFVGKNEAASSSYNILSIAHIFLPAAGFFIDVAHNNIGNPSFYGHYWSASRHTDPNSAFLMGFGTGYKSYIEAYERFRGFPVRPVMKK